MVLARVDIVALGWLIRRRYEAGSIGVGRRGGNDMADDKEEYTLLPRVVVLLISYSQYTKKKISWAHPVCPPSRCV